MTSGDIRRGEYSCRLCANKRTPICELCSVTQHPDGSSARPRYWVELGELSLEDDGTCLDTRERIVRAVTSRLESGRAVPIAFLMLYNRIVTAGEEE